MLLQEWGGRDPAQEQTHSPSCELASACVDAWDGMLQQDLVPCWNTNNDVRIVIQSLSCSTARTVMHAWGGAERIQALITCFATEACERSVVALPMLSSD